MAILSPSNLETISYGQQGWSYILTTNLQLLNTYMTKLWGPTTATYALGARPVTANATTVADPAAITQDNLTDSSAGTPSTTIGAISAVFTASEHRNNYASLTAQLAKSKADVASIRTQLIATIDYCDDLKAKLNALLSELRVTGGNGVLSN